MVVIYWYWNYCCYNNTSYNSIYSGYKNEKEALEQLERYSEISKGMEESQMLEIMGEGYLRKGLKNNKCKYEWRIEAKRV